MLPFRLPVSLFLATALTAAASGAFAADLTPLGKWMKPNMGAPLAGQDFPTVQKSLELVAGSTPPGDYPQWSAIAKTGAAAAAKQDLAALKATCKQCHDLYKAKYKKEFPTRPFP